jgi:hypothetical protein
VDPGEDEGDEDEGDAKRSRESAADDGDEDEDGGGEAGGEASGLSEASGFKPKLRSVAASEVGVDGEFILTPPCVLHS